MKVLFDQNVPHGLREMLPGHAVATVDEAGDEAGLVGIDER